ncbi:MAG: anhydro-N-acetylmuramic acid kinase [bacterium]
MERSIAATTEGPRFVLGTMTGTSIDGDLDAALVEIHGRGIGMRARYIAGLSHPLGDLANDLRRIAQQEPFTAGEFARVARAFGEAHADALEALRSSSGVRPDLAVLHGQTVFHAPPLTWQLLDPWPVATRLGCRVRYDLRGANVASGGQGAPITPLADSILFGSDDGLIVMNLGGFINATFVPGRGGDVGAIRGFDACACNHLLDLVARTRLGTAFDADGSAALHGVAETTIARQISLAMAPPQRIVGTRRSLGTGDEAARLVELTSRLDARDACRTIVEAIADAAARVIAAERPSDGTNGASLILVAGGSARNRALCDALARASGCVVRSTADSHGVPVHMREAAEIAILGALAEDGVRYALPQVTGVSSGAIDSALIEV